MRETQDDKADINVGEIRKIISIMKKQHYQLCELVKNGQVRSRTVESKIRETLADNEEMRNLLWSKLPNLYE